jgi:hypothetical protein
MKYFDIHVTVIPNKISYSIPAAIDIDDDYIDEDVISIASDKGFMDIDDYPYVDNITEIDKNEYDQIKSNPV